jgi:aspartyl-tRNA(Asn)/glutamyl-tRNA(Gln) amidotransferase subunit A
MSEGIHALDVRATAEAVRSGRLGATDTVEHALDRIDLRVARGDDPGPLAGVPIGVKELEDVAGWPHTLGSKLLADRIATTTSTQLTRARSAGAIPIGLTASPEMGAGSYTSSLLHGVCRNPWNPELTPGGSSGGSAAAVVAGLVPLATGSDSGGSLRIPAAYCGVFGFKGTYGRIPRGPGYVGSPNIRNYGVLTRTVADTARFLDCVVGADERDPLSLPHPGYRYEDALTAVSLSGLRAAWSDDLGFGVCNSEVASVARETAADFIAGAGLRERDIHVSLSDPAEAWRVLGTPDLHQMLRPHLPERAADVSPVLRFLAASAEHLDAGAIVRANELRYALGEALARIFEEIDVLLLPTTAVPAFVAEGPMPAEIGGRSVDPLTTVAPTYPFNLSGHPAASVPAGMAGGAPIGLQIVARRHEDLTVLAAAAAVERMRPWPYLAPEEAFS